MYFFILLFVKMVVIFFLKLGTVVILNIYYLFSQFSTAVHHIWPSFSEPWDWVSGMFHPSYLLRSDIVPASLETALFHISGVTGELSNLSQCVTCSSCFSKNTTRFPHMQPRPSLCGVHLVYFCLGLYCLFLLFFWFSP